MKRIDKYGLEKCKEMYLSRLPDEANSVALISNTLFYFVNFCNEEIKAVSRIETINTAEDLFEAEKEKGCCMSYDSLCCLQIV